MYITYFIKFNYVEKLKVKPFKPDFAKFLK